MYIRIPGRSGVRRGGVFVLYSFAVVGGDTDFDPVVGGEGSVDGTVGGVGPFGVEEAALAFWGAEEPHGSVADGEH